MSREKLMEMDDELRDIFIAVKEGQMNYIKFYAEVTHLMERAML